MKIRPTPLSQALHARVTFLATTLRPSTISGYRCTLKLFLAFLQETFPEIRHASQLRRDPHILAWLEHLWKKRAHASADPLCSHTRAQHLFHLRHLFELLGDHQHPPRPDLWHAEDIPRPDQLLPRPLSPEHDQALQTELRAHNDVLSTALLLVRFTGMRIGECVDAAPDCLRHLGEQQWALHVPLGKLHSERWVPADEEIRTLVARLSFLRTLPPGPTADFLLPRPRGRASLCSALRTLCSSIASRPALTPTSCLTSCAIPTPPRCCAPA